jgi:ribosomal protein L44E
LVTAGETLKEPLLHLVVSSKSTQDSDARRRQQRNQRNNPSSRNKSNVWSKEDDVERPKKSESDANQCPECGLSMITKLGARSRRCDVCRHEWV